MDPGGEEPSEDVLDARLDREEFDRYTYARSLEELELDSPGAVGFVYKCLGSAILLLRLAMRKLSPRPDPLAAATLFEELTVDLIMEGGDADTNTAAVCALLGAYLGYANLPSYWKLGLAHKEWLMEKTHRLLVATGVLRGTLVPEDDEAADGGRGLMGARELRERNAMFAKKKKAIDAKERRDAKENAEEKHRETVNNKAIAKAEASAKANTRNSKNACAESLLIGTKGAKQKAKENTNEGNVGETNRSTGNKKRPTLKEWWSEFEAEQKECESKKAEEKAKREADGAKEEEEETVKGPIKGILRRKR
jgi:hypothetical protein